MRSEAQRAGAGVAVMDAAELGRMTGLWPVSWAVRVVDVGLSVRRSRFARCVWAACLCVVRNDSYGMGV